MVTQKDAMKYYRSKNTASKAIKADAKAKKLTIYGAKALNAHLPPFLDSDTFDYDVYSKTPMKAAKRVEKKLDKKLGGDFFCVKRARHKGTYRVKSNVTNKVVADYTKPEEDVPYSTIGGSRYITIGFAKKLIKKTLKNPKAKYRRSKDKEALQRIELYEKLKKQTKKRKKRGILPDIKLGSYF